jgi:uncharacterized protein YbdZ (MbtH family)
VHVLVDGSYLFEAWVKSQCMLHAFVVMNNQFHLAPEAGRKPSGWTAADAQAERKSAPWKIAIASHPRRGIVDIVCSGSGGGSNPDRRS